MTRHLQLPTLLFLGLFALLLLILVVKMAASGYIIGSDGLGYYAHLRSLVVDGDLLYANEFLDFNPFGHAVPDPYRLTDTGHVPNPYYIGPALLWAPFFLLAHVLTLLSASLGLDLAADGYSPLYQILIGAGSVTYGMLGLALMYRLLLRFFDRNEALLATALVALATNVFYYLAVEPVMSHAMSMFAVTLFAFTWLKTMDRRRTRDVILLGFVAGIMVLVRPQNGLFLSLLGLEWLGVFRSGPGYVAHWRKHISEGLIFSAVFLVALSPQLMVWQVLYGQVFVDSYDGAGFNFSNPYVLESLFSPRHGLISWTPIVLLALVGLLLFLRNNARLGGALFLAFLLQLYLNASWADYWWFGVSFGSRAYMNCSFIFAFGLAQLLSSTGSLKALMYPVYAALILWNLLFIAQFTLGMVPQSEAVDFGQVLSNQIAMPEMVFRALWERL